MSECEAGLPEASWLVSGRAGVSIHSLGPILVPSCTGLGTWDVGRGTGREAAAAPFEGLGVEAAATRGQQRCGNLPLSGENCGREGGSGPPTSTPTRVSCYC